MRARKGRSALLATEEGANVAARLEDLRASVDATCAHARNNIEAQHAAVDAEIDALLACLRRLQAQMGDGHACTRQ